MASRRCSTRSEAAAGTGMMSNGGQTTAATQHNTQDKAIQRQHTTPTTRTSHQSLAQATAARAEQPHGVAATTRTMAPSASSWQHETKVTRHTATSGTANASLVHRLERHAAEAQAASECGRKRPGALSVSRPPYVSGFRLATSPVIRKSGSNYSRRGTRRSSPATTAAHRT